MKINHHLLSLKRLGKPVILAVASKGGHWNQLQRITPAFEGYEVIYVSTERSYAQDVSPNKFFCLREASRWNKFGFLILAVSYFALICRFRPFVIITAGSAPGYVALIIGKILGAKTVWLDSIANSEAMSLSGRLAGRWADLWLTQWEHLAQKNGPYFKGAVL